MTQFLSMLRSSTCLDSTDQHHAAQPTHGYSRLCFWSNTRRLVCLWLPSSMFFGRRSSSSSSNVPAALDDNPSQFRSTRWLGSCSGLVSIYILDCDCLFLPANVALVTARARTAMPGTCTTCTRTNEWTAWRHRRTRDLADVVAATSSPSSHRIGSTNTCF
jgi:hypothetical protein